MDALQAYICAVQLDKSHSAAWTNLGTFLFLTLVYFTKEQKQLFFFKIFIRPIKPSAILFQHRWLPIEPLQVLSQTRRRYPHSSLSCTKIELTFLTTLVNLQIRLGICLNQVNISYIHSKFHFNWSISVLQKQGRQTSIPLNSIDLHQQILYFDFKKAYNMWLTALKKLKRFLNEGLCIFIVYLF